MRKPAVLATIAALVTSTATTAIAQPESEPSLKSEGTARSLSLYGALASAGAFAVGLAFDRTGSDVAAGLVVAGGAGLMVAPSLGHWYAHHYVSTGLVIRLAGLAGVAYGLQRAFDDRPHGTEIVVGALAVVAVGAIHDVATTDTAVRTYNGALQLAPIALATPRGMATGLAVRGSF